MVRHSDMAQVAVTLLIAISLSAAGVVLSARTMTWDFSSSCRTSATDYAAVVVWGSHDPVLESNVCQTRFLALSGQQLAPGAYRCRR